MSILKTVIVFPCDGSEMWTIKTEDRKRMDAISKVATNISKSTSNKKALL